MATKVVKTKVLFLRVPAALHDEIEQLAIAEDRTLNKQAIRLLKVALGKPL